MSEQDQSHGREPQIRRTTAARRGVMAAGAAGAIGAAVVLGVSTHTTAADSQPTLKQGGQQQRDLVPQDEQYQGGDTDDDEVPDDEGEGRDDLGEHSQQPPAAPQGQLTGPGTGGPAQGSAHATSGGS